MKKQNKKKESLKMSIILLLIMAIIFVTSSYAWFTSNEAVKVSSLDVNVAAQNGLQISVDAENWKTVITKDDILTRAYSGAVNQVPDTLVPVSTAGNVTNGKLDLFYGIVAPNATGDYALTTSNAQLVDGTDNQYIAFDMFLKVDAAMDIALGTGSNVKAKENTTDKGLKNAARMAFLIEGNGASTTAVSTLTGYSGATAATRYIWEPNYDVHAATAVTYGLQTYGITTTETAASRITYDGVKAVISNPIVLAQTNATDNSTYFQSTPIAYSTTATRTTPYQIFSLQPGVTKVRVYMWVEGQDFDCENSASGSDLVFDLQIEKYTPPAVNP